MNFSTQTGQTIEEAFNEVETTTTAKDYKINDAFSRCYSRKFARDYPAFANLFEYREIRSK